MRPSSRRPAARPAVGRGQPQAEEFRALAEKLRAQAEKLLASGRARRARSGQSPEELVHELDVHRIELELQNESLRDTADQLEISRKGYAELYDFAPVGYVTLNGQGQIGSANLAFAAMLGSVREQVLRRRITSFLSRQDLGGFLKFLRELMTGRTGLSLEARLVHKSRGPYWALLRGEPAVEEAGEVRHCRVTITDIHALKAAQIELAAARDELEHRVRERTAQLEQAVGRLEREIARRRTAEAALAQRAGQLQKLSGELSRVEQTERVRLSGLLHDGIQQLLVGAKYHARSLTTHLAGEEGRRLEAQLERLLDDAVADCRSLAGQLSPPVLADSGLLTAVQWLADWCRQVHELDVLVRAGRGAEPRSAELRVMLFWAVRELLLNVRKHAGTDKARVSLAVGRDGWLEIVVSDAGRGFVSAEAGGRPGGPGFGLLSIRERIEAIGGRMTVESSPGQGTRVTLQAPRG